MKIGQSREAAPLQGPAGKSLAAVSRFTRAPFPLYSTGHGDHHPNTRAAWDGFKETLTRVSAAVLVSGKRTAADMRCDFEALRSVAARVEAEASEGIPRH